MKHFLLFIAFVFLNYLAISQVNDDQAFLLGTYNKSLIKINKIENINIEIRVAGDKIIRQLTFDTTGNLIYTATFNKKGQKVYESSSKFNLFGDKIYDKRIDFDNKVTDSSIYNRVYKGNKQIKESSQQAGYSKEYYYNSNGQVEKTITINNNGTSTSTFHSYDYNGNEVESLWIQNERKKVTKNIYSEEGKLIEFQEYFYEPSDTAGKLFLHKKLSYATNGNLIREEYLGGYFDLDKETKEYIYDNKGNLTVYRRGKEKQRFTYDNGGYLLKKETPLLGVKANSVETYSYIFRK